MQNYFLIHILLHTHIAYNAIGQNEYFWPPDWWGLTPPVFRPRAIVTLVLSSWFTIQFCPALDCCISLSKTWSGTTSAVSHRSTSSWNACTRLLWFWLEQWCLQLSLLWGSGGRLIVLTPLPSGFGAARSMGWVFCFLWELSALQRFLAHIHGQDSAVGVSVLPLHVKSVPAKHP